jgi:hypothetical protein
MSLSKLHEAVRASISGSKSSGTKTAKQLTRNEREALAAMERRMLAANGASDSESNPVDPNGMWI